MMDSEGKDVVKMDIAHVGEHKNETLVGKGVDVRFIL